MMEYNHRRAASDMAYTNIAHTNANINRRSGPISRSTLAANLEVPRQQFGHTASHDSIAAKNQVIANNDSNYNSHFRSQSCGGNYTWMASSSSHRHITPKDFPQPQLQSALPAPCFGFRRGSESSTNSTTSACTTAAEGLSPCSATTTPETLSPITPSSAILLPSSPESTAIKVGIVVTEPTSMPASTRPLRARATSQAAALKGFQNTPIELPVPEEAEVIDVSRLHQRRQQRQQKIAGGKPQVKQPVRLRLTPFPTPPVDGQLGRTPSTRSPRSTGSPRALKPSRSMPQIRDQAGPPPTGPLPPIPTMPKMSPFSAGGVPPTLSSTSTLDVHLPHPSMPPPPPPHSPALSTHSPALSTASSSQTLTPSTTPVQLHTQQQQKKKQDTSNAWEEELRRHKKLLEQFPQPVDQHSDAAAPRLTRSHRSLSNLRVRSRSTSRAAANSSSDISSRDGSVVCETWMAQTCSSFSLRGSKSHSHQRPLTAKSSKDFSGNNSRLDQPLPPLPKMPQDHKPSISVFEDDSEDEEGGDAVRKFVRNLFTRRTRSHVDIHAAKEGKDNTNGRDPKTSMSSASSRDSSTHRHNDRKKNRSASSNLSMASTVGANTCISTTTTTTLPPTTPEVPAADHYAPLVQESPLKSSSEPAPSPQKAPLAPRLTRMFVRRSHQGN